MYKLNIGCGLIKKRGFVNIDIDKSCNPDIILDCTKKLPFKDNEIDYILADNFWEHIGNEFIDMVKEWWRISKNGAVWKITVPHINTHAAFQDPTHKRYFCEESFDYFNREHIRWKQYGRRYGIPGFKVKSLIRKKRFLICELEAVK